jgi:hypothetical protein
MDFAPFAHPGPDANLPIAHRLVGFSADNATLARTIYTFFTVSEKKFDMLPACKHGERTGIRRRRDTLLKHKVQLAYELEIHVLSGSLFAQLLLHLQ